VTLEADEQYPAGMLFFGSVSDEPKSVQTFHATQDSRGKITIVRTSAPGGIGESITFDDIDDMRANFIALHRLNDVDQMIQKLTSAGTVDFEIKPT
jgi:hypothetical protein